MQQLLNQDNVLGVPRQLAGRAFTAIFFDSPKGNQKGFPLQSLTRLAIKTKNQI